jgi:hypothetical protein
MKKAVKFIHTILIAPISINPSAHAIIKLSFQNLFLKKMLQFVVSIDTNTIEQYNAAADCTETNNTPRLPTYKFQGLCFYYGIS